MVITIFQAEKLNKWGRTVLTNTTTANMKSNSNNNTTLKPFFHAIACGLAGETENASLDISGVE
jgi:hypothetical protein